jgi:hypothetical protein
MPWSYENYNNVPREEARKAKAIWVVLDGEIQERAAQWVSEGNADGGYEGFKDNLTGKLYPVGTYLRQESEAVGLTRQALLEKLVRFHWDQAVELRGELKHHEDRASKFMTMFEVP